MRIEAPLLEGRLLRRYKRFLADVELQTGERITAHCPNTGSLLGCLSEGAAVILRDSADPKRKLRYTLQTVRVEGTWVNVDTALPNAVVAEAIARGALPELAGYPTLRREVRYGLASRIDILLEADGRPACYVEVKSTTLVADGLARFPDAVTSRGLGHLEELERMVAAGARGVMVYLVGRSDARGFEPADSIDPAYGEGLRRALCAGVEALAYGARVEPDRIELGARLPLHLPPFPVAAGPRASARP
jgi:sugar fermentation stimulation protein A